MEPRSQSSSSNGIAPNAVPSAAVVPPPPTWCPTCGPCPPLARGAESPHFGPLMQAKQLWLTRHAAHTSQVSATAALHSASPVEGPRLSAFAKRWTSGELHVDYPDHVKQIDQDDNATRLATLFATKLDGPWATVGDMPLDRFTLEHALDAMRVLPAGMKRSTRAHHARALNRLLNLAVFPCRLIATNPLPRGFVPSAGKPPARSWWRPADDADLCACEDVPLLFRFFYGFTFREGLRESEAADLTWSDVRGASLALDENKTDDPRAWALYPGTPEALQAWRRIVKAAGLPSGDADPVFVHVAGNHKGKRLYPGHLAQDLRDHVTKAALWRPEFATGENRKQLDFHDLRGGFVSWALATGRTEAWVTDRTGHTSSRMIYRYKRRARHAVELGIQPPGSLLDAIPELRGPDGDGRKGGGSRKGTGSARPARSDAGRCGSDSNRRVTDLQSAA